MLLKFSCKQVNLSWMTKMRTDGHHWRRQPRTVTITPCMRFYDMERTCVAGESSRLQIYLIRHCLTSIGIPLTFAHWLWPLHICCVITMGIKNIRTFKTCAFIMFWTLIKFFPFQCLRVDNSFLFIGDCPDSLSSVFYILGNAKLYCASLFYLNFRAEPLCPFYSSIIKPETFHNISKTRHCYYFLKVHTLQNIILRSSKKTQVACRSLTVIFSDLCSIFRYY